MALTKIGTSLWLIKFSVRVKGMDYPISKQERFTGTKLEAEARKVFLIQEIRGTGSLKQPPKIKNFKELLMLHSEHLRIIGKLSTSHNTKIEFMDREIGHVPLESFIDIFQEYIKLYANTPTIHEKYRSNASVNRLVEIARAAFNHGINISIVDKNPLSRALFPKREERPRDRYLAEDEEKDLLEAVQTYRPYLLPFITYNLAVPCRKSELINLPRTAYNPFTSTIFIPDSKAGIPIHKPVPDTMKEYFKTIPLECPYLFYRIVTGSRDDRTGENKQYAPLGDFKKAWAYCLKKAKLSNFRIHDLRHRAVTSLIEFGNSESIVADAAGWTSTKMLKNYRHINSLKSAQAIQFKQPVESVPTLIISKKSK